MAGTRAYLSSCRCHLRQRRVPAMVNGAGHHTVYAHSGQYHPQKQSALRSRAFFLSSRKQQLPLSRRAAIQLWWTQCSEPYPRLHRDPQTLWGVRAKNPMHQLTVEVSCHSHPWARPATRERLGKHAWLRERTPAVAKNGKIKADWVIVKGKHQRHLEGTFYLHRYDRNKEIWRKIGPKAQEALDAAESEMTYLPRVFRSSQLISPNLSIEAASHGWLEEVKLSTRPETYELYEHTVREFGP